MTPNQDQDRDGFDELNELLKQITYIGPAGPAQLATKAMVILQAARHAPSAPAMPEGYVLLPKEATHEMCEAAHFGANCAEDALRASDREYWEEAYRDMVKAALSTPAVADVQEGWRERATKLITELDGIKVTDVARGHLKDTLAGKMGQLLRDLIAAPAGIVQAGKEHAAHCSLRFPATLNTEDDTCDCGAGKAAADGAGDLSDAEIISLAYQYHKGSLVNGYMAFSEQELIDYTRAAIHASKEKP